LFVEAVIAKPLESLLDILFTWWRSQFTTFTLFCVLSAASHETQDRVCLLLDDKSGEENVSSFSPSSKIEIKLCLEVENDGGSVTQWDRNVKSYSHVLEMKVSSSPSGSCPCRFWTLRHHCWLVFTDDCCEYE
jgi:hypothetical protein